MYNHALVTDDLDITGTGYLGMRAYGLARRVQAMATRAWREKYAGTRRSFCAMHPGWVNTASVNRSMPRFVAILKTVLRGHEQGADTLVRLANPKPTQKQADVIGFDRKERSAHVFAHTPHTENSPQDVIGALEGYFLKAH